MATNSGPVGAGTCVSCLKPTDTAIDVDGEAEFHMATLMILGLPDDQAASMVGQLTNAPAGQAFSGRRMAAYRVCTACVERTGTNMPRPGLAIPGAEIPTVYQ